MKGGKTVVFLIGFGGPESPCRVNDFIASVLEGIRVPEERIREVAHHYEVIGGTSPYNEKIGELRENLALLLKERGEDALVVAGYRHANPNFEDALARIRDAGATEAHGFVLSAFRSYASFEKYRERVQKAQEALNLRSLKIHYTAPFYKHPLFIEAQCDEIRAAQAAMPPEGLQAAYYLFSAHSIPVKMARQSRYAEEFREAATLIAGELKLPRWSIAYQSRSGNPDDSWLEPGVLEVVKSLPPEIKELVVIPLGFVCENVEILYDLDVELRETAQERGFQYRRARAVSGSDKFIRMAAQLTGQRIGELS